MLVAGIPLLSCVLVIRKERTLYPFEKSTSHLYAHMLRWCVPTLAWVIEGVIVWRTNFVCGINNKSFSAKQLNMQRLDSSYGVCWICEMLQSPTEFQGLSSVMDLLIIIFRFTLTCNHVPRPQKLAGFGYLQTEYSVHLPLPACQNQHLWRWLESCYWCATNVSVLTLSVEYECQCPYEILGDGGMRHCAAIVVHFSHWTLRTVAYWSVSYPNGSYFILYC